MKYYSTNNLLCAFCSIASVSCIGKATFLIGVFSMVTPRGATVLASSSWIEEPSRSLSVEYKALAWKLAVTERLIEKTGV